MFSISEGLLGTYFLYGGLLIAKVLMMSFLTARQRLGRGIFASEEDTSLKKDSKVSHNDPNVERVRRAHLNDLENVIPFLLIVPIYLTTHPSTAIAVNLMRIFTGARYLHTFVYLNEIRQPARFYAFLVNVLINWYMLGCIIYNYFAHF